MLVPARAAMMIGCVLSFTGCASRNVLLNEHIQRAHRQQPPVCDDTAKVSYDDPDVLRVYFDRDGDLYPFPGVPVLLDDAMFSSARVPLRAAFDTGKAAFPAWKDLARSLGVDVDSPGAWAQIQAGLRRRIATQINAVTGSSGGNPRPLVILVHGFNVADAECTYQRLRERIDTLAGDVAYLQVNWDGLTTTSPTPPIWGEAQFNFPLVGMGLRRLLLDVAGSGAAIPLRFLTHSSGGPVVAQALWDASASEGPARRASNWRAYRELQEMRRADTIPRPPRFVDIRIGMIVPAMPASVFDNYNLGDGGPARILIGMNPSDIAVGKSILVPCSVGGNTCLPVRASYACSVRARFANELAPKIMLFDFSGSSENVRAYWFHDEHDWRVYLLRDKSTPFLSALFGSSTEDDSARLCLGS